MSEQQAVHLGDASSTPLLDQAGNTITVLGYDIYSDSQFVADAGMCGRYWRDDWGRLLPPQDVVFIDPMHGSGVVTVPFAFQQPLHLSDGNRCHGWDGRQWITVDGVYASLDFPVIFPSPPVDLDRINKLLARVPSYFLHESGRVARHIGIDRDRAQEHFKLRLPNELLCATDVNNKPVCPTPLFLRWYLGFTAEEVDLLLAPESDGSERCLIQLVAKMDPRQRVLWDAVQAGDESARRELATWLVQYCGDRPRAALIYSPKKIPTMRSLDDS